MAGILRKNLIASTVKYSGTPGTPGDPGAPALPARCITGTQTITNPASYVIYEGKMYYTPASSYVSTVTTCYPPQPARPPIPGIPSTADRTVYTSNIGWTGGGRSVDVMIEGGTFNFTVPYAVAVIVGLVESDQTTSPNEALHAFYIYRSAINIREAGSNVFLCAQTHAPANIYSIQRAGGLTHYLINGVTVYSSASRSTLPLMLDASLYAAGDTVVIEPLSLSTSGRIDGSFEPLVARLGVVNYAEIDGSFEPLGGDLLSRPRTLLDGFFQPLLGLLGNYSQIDGSFEVLTGELESNSISPTVSILDGEFLPLLVRSIG